MCQTVTVTIETSNAAFEDNRAAEVSRILQTAAWQLEHDYLSLEHPFAWDLPLKDANGNTVGKLSVTPTQENDNV